MNDQGLGKRQRHALEFVRANDGWQSYANDVETIVQSLAERCLVEYSPATRQFRALYPLHCDQCEMLTINGLACHETGCPNEKKTWIADRGEWVLFVACFDCGFDVEVGETCSCLEPMDIPEEIESEETV